MPNDNPTPLDPQHSLTYLLEECRMVLPGIQALFGFQLVAVYEPPFWQRLSFAEQIAHLSALALMAMAIGMVLMPASYHRIVEPNSVSPKFLRVASRFMSAGMACLMGAIVIDVYVIANLIVHNVVVATTLAGAICLILGGLWYVLPLSQRRRSTDK